MGILCFVVQLHNSEEFKHLQAFIYQVLAESYLPNKAMGCSCRSMDFHKAHEESSKVTPSLVLLFKFLCLTLCAPFTAQSSYQLWVRQSEVLHT